MSPKTQLQYKTWRDARSLAEDFVLMRVAALTMAYNEPVWAKVWAGFYARQVGAAHCFLLDHGSDDGSTEGLGISVERIPRVALDEHERAAKISDRVAELLGSYDAVIHSDVDELVVADPERFADLTAFAADVSDEVVTAVGLDVQHLPAEEQPLDPMRPIGAQRCWTRFSAAMCKPCFVRRPVNWSPGFHECDATSAVSGLFLMHLRYADLPLGLRRLERTRAQAFADPGTNMHQRVSDEEFAQMVRNIGQLPRESIRFDAEAAPIREWIDRVRAAQLGGAAWLSIAGDRLWRLPEVWRALF
jgi:hypothetical protein